MSLPVSVAELELELKGEERPALVAMADLLERMRTELDQQFRDFSSLRDGATRRSQEDLPEAEAKLARADLKAAVEALSVIVRTLEKVDQLQRQLARDRADLEAMPASQEAFEALHADIERLIEARVEERLAMLVAAGAGGSAGSGSGPPSGLAADAPDPPDLTAAGG